MGTINDHRDWSSWGTSGYGSTTTTLGWFNGGVFVTPSYKSKKIVEEDIFSLFDVPKI